MPLIPFTKMHGLGNDFVVLDWRDPALRPAGLAQAAPAAPLPPDLARRLCDRRLGIGADQILLIAPPTASVPGPDARMIVVNADGSTAEMCGNGIRAVALYLQAHGPVKKDRYAIETGAGVLTVEIRDAQVSVDMGKPVLGGGKGLGKEGEGLLQAGRELELEGCALRFFEVSMGNPHAVIFVQSAEAAPVETLGPLVERHPRFPQRTNVEFVQLEGADRIRVRVWERGAGATLACGTGACASAVAAIATGLVQSPVEVELPGGVLTVAWEGADRPVTLTGPATEVFRGEFDF